MRVAVLEDDAVQADLVIRSIEVLGHNCTTFTSGAALTSKLRQETYDLLILDWNVPDVQGIEVLAWAHQHLSPPPAMLMLTGRSEVEDVVAALNAGADDFLIKPIEPQVLRARVQAVLRRAYPTDRSVRPEAFGRIGFDPVKQCATVDGAEVPLTSKEFALALAFFRNLHRPLGRAYLLESVWGRRHDLASRTLDAHVSKIRAKLNLRPEKGYRLAPVYSYGYRLERLHEGETLEN
jgi:DNA-binding response OmpR family regulator